MPVLDTPLPGCDVSAATTRSCSTCPPTRHRTAYDNNGVVTVHYQRFGDGRFYVTPVRTLLRTTLNGPEYEYNAVGGEYSTGLPSLGTYARLGESLRPSASAWTDTRVGSSSSSTVYLLRPPWRTCRTCMSALGLRN